MMVNSTMAPLGILSLESGVPQAERGTDTHADSVFNPETFNFPVIYEVVPEAWVDRVLPGDPSLEEGYVSAAKRLVQRGAIALVGDCGFTIRYQAAVAAAVEVPVAMSCLLLAPMLLRQIPPSGKLAVVTADSNHCTSDLLGIRDGSDRARIVIGGVEGGVMWQNEMRRPARPTSVSEIKADVTACVTRLRDACPDTAAILLECTLFPTITPELKRQTGLPIYDTATLYRMTYGSVG